MITAALYFKIYSLLLSQFDIFFFLLASEKFKYIFSAPFLEKGSPIITERGLLDPHWPISRINPGIFKFPSLLVGMQLHAVKKRASAHFLSVLFHIDLHRVVHVQTVGQSVGHRK